MELQQVVAQSKETPFVHIMAYSSMMAMMNDSDPIHIDSMPEYEWLELKQTPKEYVSFVAGTKAHAAFIERDTMPGPFSMVQTELGWSLAIQQRAFGELQPTKEKCEMALRTILEPAYNAFKKLEQRHALQTRIDAVSSVYKDDELLVQADIAQALMLACDNVSAA